MARCDIMVRGGENPRQCRKTAGLKRLKIIGVDVVICATHRSFIQEEQKNARAVLARKR